MRSNLLLTAAVLLAAACADDPARCGTELCAGPPGLPCRCGASSNGSDASTGPSKGVGMAGGTEGAAGSSASSAAITLDSTAQDSVTEVTVGQTIDLTLGTIGPGNYADPQLSSSAVAFDGSEYPPMQNPGGPTQIYHFHGVAPGTVTVTIPHTGDGRAPFTLTFHVS